MRISTQRIVGAVLLSLLLAAVPALAATNWHTTGGPEGGTVYSVAFSPHDSQIIYAGTGGGGVFKSSNGGASWQAANSGLKDYFVWTLAVDYANSDTVYAGTDSGGVFKSIDGGASWSEVNTGLGEAGPIRKLAIDPVSGTIFAGALFGVFKSSNGGASWSNPLAGYSDVTSLAIAGNGQMIWAGTNGSGLYKSSDGGQSWSIAWMPDLMIVSLALAPDSPQTIYVGTALGDVYKSSDSATSWKRIKTGLSSALVAIDSGGQAIYAAGDWGTGIFKSADGGTTWSAISSGVTYDSVVFLGADPGQSQTLYAGTVNGGIFRSTNGGASWSAASSGLAATAVNTLAIDATGGTSYAGTQGSGVFKSNNAAGSWTPVLIDEAVSHVAINPADDRNVYAVTQSGLFVSTSGGSSWQRLEQYFNFLTFVPGSQAIYAAGSGVFKSTSAGASWTSLNQGLPTYTSIAMVAIDPANSEVLYAASHKGVFKTVNGGGSWLASNSGLPAGVWVEWLVISPADNRTIYAATDAGVYKSTDAAASWANTGLTDTYITFLAIDPLNSQNLYAVTEDSRLFESRNGGTSWQSANAGLPPYAGAVSISVDPADSDTLYAATSGRGVFKSGEGPPTISGTPSPNATAGRNYLFTPTSTNATSFTITGKPTWANFESASGTLWGKPPNVGSTHSNIMIAAHNDAGSAALDPFSITVKTDDLRPTVTAFTVTSPVRTLTVPVTSFTATDDSGGVAGYLITSSYLAPAATAAGWSDTPPGSYLLPSSSVTALYAWAKDGVGRVSYSKNAAVAYDATAPVIASFSVRTPCKSRDVPVTSFSATDNRGVKGYLVTETSTPPEPSAEWQAAPPATYTVAADGETTLYAWARDGAGNVSAFRSAAASVDTVKPEITLLAPEFSKSLTFPITPSASDFEGVTGYMITLSSQPPSTTAYGWSLKPPASFTAASSGVKTLYAWAKDAAGNVSAATATVKVDTIPPAVTNFTPASPLSSLSVPITALSASDNMGVTGYMITDSATPPAASADGWSETAPGSYLLNSSAIRTLYAWARDGAGNVSAARSAAVNVDTTAPVVGTFAVRPLCNSLTVPVTAFSASDNTAVTGYLITEEEATPQLSSGWKFPAPTWYLAQTAGPKTLYAWARDGAGNIALSKQAVTTIDNVPPQITFDAPQFSRSLAIPVTLGATGGATGYAITLTSSTPTAWSGTPPASFAVLSTGVKKLYAYAKDAAGNVAVATATVNVDMTAPLVTAFTVPAKVKSLTVPVTSFSASDATGVTGYLITTTSSAPSASGAGWSTTPPVSHDLPSSATRTLYAWAKDGAGNVSAARSAAVNVDSTAPAVGNFVVRTPWNSLTLQVTSFTGTDNIGIAGYLITASDTAPDPSAAGWRSSAPTSYASLVPGDITLHAWVKDGAGNVSAHKSAAARIDNAKPQISNFAAPARNKSLTIPITSFDASDNYGVTGYLITTSYYTPGAALTTWRATPPASFAVTLAGTTTLYAWAKDAVGNVSAAATAKVNVDLAKPFVTAFTLGTPVGLTVPVTSLAAGDNTAVTGYLVTESGTAPPDDAAWSGTRPTSYTFSSTGTKTLYAWAKDAAGNVSPYRAATVIIR